MAKEGSVAPKERINIKYIPATGDQQSEIELPLKMLVIGDFKGHSEDSQLEDRESVRIDKTTFNSVMADANLEAEIVVKNHLSEAGEDGELDDLPVKLQFSTLADFSPDSVVKNVPELSKLLELREALVALKGPMGNVPDFRNKLQEVLKDEASRKQLAQELELVLDESKN